MKVLALIAILVAVALNWRWSRIEDVQEMPPPNKPVPPGQTNPPLRRVVDQRTLKSGDLVWLRTNELPFMMILENGPDGILASNLHDGGALFTPTALDKVFVRK